MRKYFILVLLPLLIGSCKVTSWKSGNKSYTVHELEKGLIDCFTPTWDSVKNDWTYCELSAAVYYQQELFVASDKAIPNQSSVFSLDIENNHIKNPKALKYLDQKLLKTAIKYEDFSISPDQKYIFLTTAFDRIKEDGWDAYNCLIAWPSGQPEQAQLINPSQRNGVKSSLGLRKKIRLGLANNNSSEGPKYFKVEGIALTPDKKLIFGIREMGERYDNFQYTIALLAVSYEIGKDGTITLGEDVKCIYRFDPLKSEYKDLKLPIALSSIEYDPFQKRFYLTTSYEHENRMGGYLWILSEQNIERNQAPSILRTSEGAIFEMNHKAEAVSVLGKNKVIVVHDDDRNTESDRAAHQSAYQILEIK